MPGGAMPGRAHFEGLSSALLSATKCRLPPKPSSASLRGAAEEGQSNGRGTSFSFGAMPSSGGKPGKRLFSLPHAAGTALPKSQGSRSRVARSGHPQTRSPPPTRAALALAGHKCTERAGLSLPSSGGCPHGVPMPALLHFVPSPRLQHWRMFEERSPVTPNAQALTTPPGHQASWGTEGSQPPGRSQKPHRVLQKG